MLVSGQGPWTLTFTSRFQGCTKYCSVSMCSIQICDSVEKEMDMKWNGFGLILCAESFSVLQESSSMINRFTNAHTVEIFLFGGPPERSPSKRAP